MAENKEPTEILEVPEEEEVDLIFRAEMKARDIILGYWKHSLVVLGAVLLVALVIGLYQQYLRGVLRDGSEAISLVDEDQPPPSQLAQMGLAPLDDPADAERMKTLEELARRYEAAADDTTGAARAEGWLKAADTWRRLGRDDEARRLFELLSAEPGMFAAAGHNGLAALALEAGDVDTAAVHLRAIADAGEDLFAERALMDLIRIEQSRNEAAAAALIDEFRLRFPSSPRLEELSVASADAAPAELPDAVPPGE